MARLALISALCLISGLAAAQYPSVMNYQVMLTNDLDEPLADQSVELVFRVYENETGGVAQWTETHNTTTNSIGVASVVLGSITPLPLYDWLGLFWLEIEVDGEVMSPRRRLTSSPYALMSFDTMRLDGEVPSYYATDDELSASGTINSPSNPVDWTMLKNVPSGIADGTDDVGGAGDGHSLDAWDGDPVDAVWVAGNGKVGIGTTNPTATMHVHLDTMYFSRVRLTNSETGTGEYDGLEIYMGPFGSAGVHNYFGSTLSLGSGPSGTPNALLVRSDGSVDVGFASVVSGELNVFGTHSTGTPVHRSYEDEFGGQYTLTDEETNSAVTFGADPNGTGGRLLVQRNDTFSYSDGIDLNGNWAGTGEPVFRVLGSTNAAAFDMSTTGNSSVVLPNDSVYDNEILDEPGVAGIASSDDVTLVVGTNVLKSKTIETPPGSGYVLAIASGQADVYHTTGTYTDLDIGISDNASNLPTSQGMALTLDEDLTSGSYNFPLTSHALFHVDTAGNYTYYYLARHFSGDVQIDELNLTLVFLPTVYGEVIPTQPAVAGAPRDDAESRTGLSHAEIEAERTRTHEANLARIERELEEIQAQLEALREER
jgi:hypothetical protein